MNTEDVLAVAEAAAVGLAGAALGGLAGALCFGLLAVPGAAVGGLNGLVSGARGVYDWRSPKGWFAFVSDSTWALLGTAGAAALHVVNYFYPNSGYRAELSRRMNRHVYDSGVALRPALALTLGNVISNAGQGRHDLNVSFLKNHEELHIWQGRVFGPLYQATYAAWFPLGAVVAFVVWLADRRQPLGCLVETAAYYNNPFEYWAYRNDDYWPPRQAHPKLCWGRRARGTRAGGDAP